MTDKPTAEEVLKAREAMGKYRQKHWSIHEWCDLVCANGRCGHGCDQHMSVGHPKDASRSCLAQGCTCSAFETKEMKL